MVTPEDLAAAVDIKLQILVMETIPQQHRIHHKDILVVMIQVLQAQVAAALVALVETILPGTEELVEIQYLLP